MHRDLADGSQSSDTGHRENAGKLRKPLDFSLATRNLLQAFGSLQKAEHPEIPPKPFDCTIRHNAAHASRPIKAQSGIVIPIHSDLYGTDSTPVS